MFRVLLRSIVTLVLLAATVFVGWRVLAPAEVLAKAKSPYPATLVAHRPGITGHTNVAPLIVEDRIRVYGTKRQIRADWPAAARTVYTARWSFRRWPQQLAGAVAVGHTVVSRWSDGKLIAINARTGNIIWRAAGPAGPGYTGHRTGAQTVWAPTGLHTGSDAIVVAQDDTRSAYDVRTGARRWTVTVPDGCGDGFTTIGGQYVCASGAYELTTGQPAASWPAGPYAPLGCGVAASGCAGVRDGAGQGWYTDAAVPRRATGLDVPGSTIAAGLVLAPVAGGVQASTMTGEPIRTYRNMRVLGAAGDGVAMLNEANYLKVIDPRTGVTRANVRMAYGSTEKTDFKPGLWQLTDNFVALERLMTDGPADPDKPDHYLTTDTVLIAAV